MDRTAEADLMRNIKERRGHIGNEGIRRPVQDRNHISVTLMMYFVELKLGREAESPGGSVSALQRDPGTPIRMCCKRDPMLHLRPGHLQLAIDQFG